MKNLFSGNKKQLLAVTCKSSIIDDWQGFKYSSIGDFQHVLFEILMDKYLFKLSSEGQIMTVHVVLISLWLTVSMSFFIKINPAATVNVVLMSLLLILNRFYQFFLVFPLFILSLYMPARNPANVKY